MDWSSSFAMTTTASSTTTRGLDEFSEPRLITLSSSSSSRTIVATEMPVVVRELVVDVLEVLDVWFDWVAVRLRRGGTTAPPSADIFEFSPPDVKVSFTSTTNEVACAVLSVLQYITIPLWLLTVNYWASVFTKQTWYRRQQTISNTNEIKQL